MESMKNRKYFQRIVTLLLALVLMCSVRISTLAAPAFNGGSGTAKDPYLVATAEQLNAIRNNLSAHYKLANTIDLSGIANFTPIGNLERPFTGSLSCDLGTDGLPKYAIKNLKVKVAAKNYVAENKNKWEAAMFGASKGASFTNIFVLNAKVSNDNFGDNTGNVVYGDYKPGMDEQFSAALVGKAIGSTITGCMSSGNIDTKSNNAAGLVGAADSSTIANCYSTANVRSQGKWNVAGLVGSMGNGSTLTSSFYKGGEVSCGSEYSSQGMLFASATDCIISDCYASGKGLGGQANLGSFTKTSVSNCYSVASVGKPIPVDFIGTPSGNSVKNVFILNSGNISINIADKYNGIQYVGASQIKSAFSGLSAWNTSGTYPTLKNVITLSDEGRYVPGAGETGTDVGTNTTTPGTTENTVGQGQTTTTEVEVLETTDLEELKKIAEALPTAAELSAKNIDDVLKAKAMLDNLPDSLYAQLDAAISTKVSECYDAIQPIMLEYLVSELEKMDVKKLKAEDKKAVLRLNEIYNGLNDLTKEALSSTLVDKLKEGVEKVSEFSDEVSASVVVEMSTMEKVVILFLILIALLIFAANIVVIILVLKKKKVLNRLDTKAVTKATNGNGV